MPAMLAAELNKLAIKGLMQTHNEGEAVLTFEDSGDGAENFYTHEEPATRPPKEGEAGPQPIMFRVRDPELEDTVPTKEQAITRERRVKPEILAAVTKVINAHIDPKAVAAREARAAVVERIVDLERQVTPRMLREAALGNAKMLQAIDEQINEERGKLP